MDNETAIRCTAALLAGMASMARLEAMKEANAHARMNPRYILPPQPYGEFIKEADSIAASADLLLESIR
jgi:hypothetical protein